MKANEKFNDLAEAVTNEIIALLETGTVAWRKPWTSFGMPQNAATHRNYEGFNAFYLNMVTISKNYTAPFFMTYKQANQLGANVRKGEKGYPIVFWKIDNVFKGIVKDEKGDDEATFRKRFVPFIWTVFNIDQIDGIEFDLTQDEKRPNDIIAECQHIVTDMPHAPKINHGGNQAYYSQISDYVQMPDFDSFINSELYYKTLFHELIHSTGHKNRLDRFSGEVNDRDEYSKEELTAELGAAFICAKTGLMASTIETSAAYIKAWLKVLKNDKSLIFSAATKAGKAANYIIGNTIEEEAETETNRAVA